MVYLSKYSVSLEFSNVNLQKSNLSSKIVSSGKVFKPKQTVPVTSSATTWIMMHNLIHQHTTRHHW